MKKIGATVLFVFSLLIARSQDITGQWNGLLKVQGTQLRVVFNISKTDSGYSATMDSPDQGVKGIPVSSVSYKDSVLQVSMPKATIEYKATLNKENILTGLFKQSGQTFPLNLSREKIEKKEVVRSQEPIPPYPYHSEDIQFENKDAGITLAGTLTLPEEKGNFPAVVLITGSGPQNRNEELMGHKPFLVLSDYLTRHGIAVLRFDDRGIGLSKGSFVKATSADFATDAEAAVRYLQSRKEINTSKIGLIGHSEGGIIAPMVAAKNNYIDFIVLLAGTGIPGGQLLLMQQEGIARASGTGEEGIQKLKSINSGAFDIVTKSADTAAAAKELAAYLNKVVKNDTEIQKQSGMTEEKFIQYQVKQLESPWMYYFIRYDPAVNLEKVKCPVLAVNGERDLQVSPGINLAAIKAAVEKGGNKNVTIKQLPGLNHLFQECTTGLPAEYADIEQTFSPAALDEITDWIVRVTK